MDDAGDPIGGDRGAIEAQRMAKINRRPVSIDVTDTKVTFRVRFHVRFEDSRPESRFGELKSSLQQAIDTTWNQRLTGDALGGRKFEIVPDVVKVGRTSARDQNYWLITVRSADTGKIEYPGCTVEQPDPNAEPTSVTDPFCDGGVMSIPPLHIARPNILGHELLHFFGFVDRYREVITEGKDKKKHTDLQPTRVTGKRADPLAGRGGAPVLAEDLSMIFENLGVYDTEKMRGLDVLTRLEKQGMSLTQVQAEIARQQEILSTGHDPLMTPPPKKSFIDKTIKSVDDLPI
jgi:hypothetical protein